MAAPPKKHLVNGYARLYDAYARTHAHAGNGLYEYSNDFHPNSALKSVKEEVVKPISSSIPYRKILSALEFISIDSLLSTKRKST